MKIKDYREMRMQDPEMQAAYQKLRPKLELGRQILHARLERGWTQKELAQKSGTKQANISRLENALLNPTVEMLQKLADALGTRLEIKLEPEEEEAKPTTEEQGILVHNWPGRERYALLDDRAEIASGTPSCERVTV